MKKIMFLSAVAILLGISTPQESFSTPTINDLETVEENKYIEIEVSELPQKVRDAIVQENRDLKIEKAYKSNDGTFKVVVEQNGEKKDLYFDRNGNSVKSTKKEAH